ncbi:MAG TPA: hypothetical protein VGP93_06840, partial [Polyangiaceae bacterium]|nr:hypothetical protein [Polyangiaceae bacterium]
MLVLLGPEFDGKNESYARLAQATGLVAYDLKARLKPGAWGVVKAFGDFAAARELAGKVAGAGFAPVLVERSIMQDPERRIVLVSAIELGDEQMQLQLGDRVMPVPYGALCCIVEGEVQLGRIQSFTPTPSSSSFRAPTAAEVSAFRESYAQPGEAFLAADLHFATVLWIARIDSRHFDFGAARTGNTQSDLEALLQRIAERASGVRIDRSVKTSSVVSVALQRGAPSSSLAPPSIRHN